MVWSVIEVSLDRRRIYYVVGLEGRMQLPQAEGPLVYKVRGHCAAETLFGSACAFFC